MATNVLSPAEITRIREGIEYTGVGADRLRYGEIFGFLTREKGVAKNAWAQAASEIFAGCANPPTVETDKVGAYFPGWKVRVGVQLTSAALGEPSDVLPYRSPAPTEVREPPRPAPAAASVLGAQAQALEQAAASARLRPSRIDDHEVRTASTTMTVGGRVDGIRARLGAPRPSDASARIAELEDTVRALNEALEKVNVILRNYRDAFNRNSDLLDETRVETGNLRHCVTGLREDVDALYEH